MNNLYCFGNDENDIIDDIDIGRDPLTSMSRGVCYVEMNSVVDSMFLHNQLIASPPVIDGKQVEVREAFKKK